MADILKGTEFVEFQSMLEMHNDIGSYYDFVATLAKSGENKLFFNSGPVKAAIVMSRIFHHAEETIRIYSGGFNGAISNDEEYLKQLQYFLQKPDTSLKILVQEDYSCEPHCKIFSVLRKFSEKVIIHHTESKVSMQSGNISNHIHFTIGDKRMIRIETGIHNYTAQANFNDGENAKILIDLFENKMVKGAAINLGQPANALPEHSYSA